MPIVIKNLWGLGDVDFVFSDSNGQSGGTLLMWSTFKFSREGDVIENHYSGAIGHWVNNLMSSLDCIWVLFGDLNVVRNIDERVGSSFNAHEASTFNDFIASFGLHDFPLGGRRFNWFNKAVSKMSKLDQFLVSQNFFNVWPNASVTAQWWNPLGSRVCIMELLHRPKNKIKQLKVNIKSWHANKKYSDCENMKRLTASLESWEDKADNGLISHNDVKDRDEAIISLRVEFLFVSSQIESKSHVFPPNAIQTPSANILTPSLDKFDAVTRICDAVSTHCVEDVKALEATITLEEVKEAVWSCEGSKAPGPDGVKFNFIKHHWDVLKEDFYNCVK
ncbi:RNA-directed DNA polymerase, eukaryota [Tanacetum coccineum]